MATFRIDAGLHRRPQPAGSRQTLPTITAISAASSPGAASTSRRSPPRCSASRSRCRAGASAPAARASAAFPAPASRATSTRSSRTARPSSSWCGSRPRSPRISPGTRSTTWRACVEQAAGSGPRLRRGQLQHLPGPARPERSATSSARSATPTRRCASRRSQHNLECIEIGRQLGCKALTVWIADGANFAGQQHLTRAFDRYLDSMAADLRGAARRLAGVPRAQVLRAGLLRHGDRRLGHAPTSRRSRLGPKAKCLVDLGHHAPNANIEQIVARLIAAEKLGGLPLQRQQVRRRRPRQRLDRPVPAVPGVQRAGRGRSAKAGPASRPPT